MTEPAGKAPPAPPLALVDDDTEDDYALIRHKGHVQACEHNAFIIFGRAGKYDDVYFDEFLHRIRFSDRDWIDADLHEAVRWIQIGQRVASFSRAQCLSAITSLAYGRKMDSLKRFVQNLPRWDEVPRIEYAFCDGWGATETTLHRQASENFFIALIARALQPGAQVDTMWAFEGGQGIFKSRALRALGGEYHTEVTAAIGSSDFMRELRGIWIAELSELESIRGKEASTIKRVLSAPVDRFVDKFEKYADSYPRRAIAVATTNESAGYWQDSTGARRLVPITCGTIRVDLIEDNRLQWLAEAKHLYERGAKWWEWPTSIKQIQEDRQQGDPWEDVLQDAILNGKRGMGGLHEDWPEGKIRSADIMTNWLKLEPAQQASTFAGRLGRVMRKMGFEPCKIGTGKAQCRGWVWAGEGSPQEKWTPPRQRPIQSNVIGVAIGDEKSGDEL